MYTDSILRGNRVPANGWGLLLVALLMVGLAEALLAQTGETTIPQLEIEDVIIVGRPTVVLPSARKGEVYDTLLYTLGSRDSLLFADRISYLGGSGGQLPAYREIESPIRGTLEGSVGSYISPRLRGHVEYSRKRFDLMGTAEYRSTAGHTDSAEASTIRLNAGGSLLMPGDNVMPQQRLAADLEWINDGYFLYGATGSRFDRSRSAARFGVGLTSEQTRTVSYEMGIGIAATSVSDRLGDSSMAVSATSPDISVGIGIKLDSTRIVAHVNYATTSLDYSTSTRSPSNLQIGGDVEMRPSELLRLTAGVGFATGGHSDSGSTSGVVARGAVWYRPAPAFAVFGRFVRELRTASYRDRLMRAPYVDREMPLRPELVTASFAGGFQSVGPAFDIEAEGFIELADNTPVVSLRSDSSDLVYTHVASRTLGVRGHATLRLGDGFALGGDAVIAMAVDDSTDSALPMRPAIVLNAHAAYALSSAFDMFATLGFRSAQKVSLENGASAAAELGSRFVVGLGATYRVLETLEIFGEASNLLNLRYDEWHNYSAPGVEVRGGARLLLRSLLK